jgi:CRISPR-associated protein Cas6
MDSDRTERLTQMVDLVFGVRGSRMPSDYRFALWSALRCALPWVDQEPATGIVGIRLTQTGGPTALLARRAKLTLRLPSHRVAEAGQLEGARVDFGSESIEIGASHPRPLVPTRTLYAQLVALGPEDESDFARVLADELGALGIGPRFILGRRRSLRGGERELVGYPVVLHDCSADHSMQLQQAGLGPQRGLGCGIFVPHKKIEGIE